MLNPPFDRPCVRDNYCSYTSKAGDLWSPIDLLVQSGILSRRHQVAAVDAVAEKLSPEACRRAATDFGAEAILALTGSLSWEADSELLARMAADRPGVKIALTGDFLVTAAAGTLARFPFVEAVLTDYASGGLERWLSGEDPPYEGLVTRATRPASGVAAAPASPPGGGLLTYPLPAHDLFSSKRYRLSVLEPGPFAVVITSMGCNFHCPYCIDSVIPIRYRPIGDVLAELDWLEGRGVRNLYFYDPNFTARPARTIELCAAMSGRGARRPYVCNATVACLTPAVVDALASSGCKTVMLGLESGNDAILLRNRKGFTTAKARAAIGWCKAAGIRVLAYFLLGLPGETRETAESTIEFATSLPLDYASFNIFSPSVGTALAERCDTGVEGPAAPTDRSAPPARSFCDLAPAELGRIRRRALLRFYGRPRYLAARLSSVTSWQSFERQAIAALGILRGALT